MYVYTVNVWEKNKRSMLIAVLLDFLDIIIIIYLVELR